MTTTTEDSGPPESNEHSVEVIVGALRVQVNQLADRVYDAFARAVPAAGRWPEQQQGVFIEQAKGRFNAVLAVIIQGAEIDEALQEDLRDVGAGTAWSGSSLQNLLLILRLSRDVLLQAAMRLDVLRESDENRNGALSQFLGRTIPVIDRFTDALSHGYWMAKLQSEQEFYAPSHSLAENAPFGMYETDVDGILHFANPALADLLGIPDEKLEGRSLGDVFKPLDPKDSIASLLSEPVGGIGHIGLCVGGPEGAPVMLEVDIIVRRVDDVVAGFGGIVRPPPIASTGPTPTISTQSMPTKA